jgi:hemolysin activation/secretion protein
MTARQQRGQPLSLRQMERAVSVLADTPGAVVTVALAGGERDGETDIVVTVSDRDRVSGSVMTDNAGSRSTGAARTLVAMSLDNVLGGAEQVSTTLMASDGTRYGLLSASIPLGYEGWRVGASASALEYRLVAGGLASAGAQGRATTWPSGCPSPSPARGRRSPCSASCPASASSSPRRGRLRALGAMP